MKRLSFLLLVGLFTQLAVSCYPGGADDVEDLDVVLTNYDKSVDFSNFTTYSLADTVVYFTEGVNVVIDHQYDQAILGLVESNFNALGYTKVDPAVETPSFAVVVSAFSNVTYEYFVDYWYDYWGWYWPYFPYYPWYPVPVTVYSYRTGSIVIEMINSQPTLNNRTVILWTGITDGVLDGGNIPQRIENGINQCFIQSPYLKK